MAFDTTQPDTPQRYTDPTQPAPATVPAQAAPATAQNASIPGLDPALANIYRNAGVTPADRGTGFADWQYWQGVGPSQYDRLTKDLAGTGTDQPTGTPGSGAWQTSGQGVLPAMGTGTNLGSFGSFLAGIPGSSVSGSPINGPYPPVNLGQSPVNTGALQGNQNDLFGILKARANQPLNVDPNDPIIKAQTDAFNAQQNRSDRSYLSKAAEGTGPNTNLDATARSLAENAGQAGASFQANALQNELNARRAQQQAATQEAGSLLPAEQQLSLSRALGGAGLGLQQQGISNQNQQFYSGLGQQDQQFLKNLALQYAGLGAQTGLAQQGLNSQNDQFAANYGLNATNQANYWDSLRSGLTGG